jgi:hypothetical protein
VPGVIDMGAMVTMSFMPNTVFHAAILFVFTLHGVSVFHGVLIMQGMISLHGMLIVQRTILSFPRMLVCLIIGQLNYLLSVKRLPENG